MLSEIDTQWRRVTYNDFMDRFVPGEDLQEKHMEKASEILAKGLSLQWTKKKIPEWKMYPVLVSMPADLGRMHTVAEAVLLM